MTPRDADVIGHLPDGATHFGVRRKKSGDEWDRLDAPATGGGAVRDFPADWLSLKWIRKTFGPGKYRVIFLRLTAGVRQVRGNGRIFELRPKKNEVVFTAPDPAFTLLANAVKPMLEKMISSLTDVQLDAVDKHIAANESLRSLSETFPRSAEGDRRRFYARALSAFIDVAAEQADLRALVQPTLLGLAAHAAVTAMDGMRALHERVLELEGRAALSAQGRAES